MIKKIIYIIDSRATCRKAIYRPFTIYKIVKIKNVITCIHLTVLNTFMQNSSQEFKKRSNGGIGDQLG